MNTNQILTALKKDHKAGGIYDIHRSTGLPVSWLYKVARGSIKAPQAERIDTLRDYFAAKDKAA